MPDRVDSPLHMLSAWESRPPGQARSQMECSLHILLALKAPERTGLVAPSKLAAVCRPAAKNVVGVCHERAHAWPALRG